MLERIKKHKLIVIVAAIYLLVFIIAPSKAMVSLNNSLYYLKEMAFVMPVIFVLTVTIEAWVPKKVIMNGLGEGSGAKGILFSILLGSLSAGPIYAAFPVTKTLLKKGASIPNIVIILSSWAVIKVPMLANEAKFLSPKFMLTRWVLTVIAIIVMSYIMGLFVKKKDLPLEQVVKGCHISEDYCIGCGFCVRKMPKNFEIQNQKAVLISDEGLDEPESLELSLIHI